MTQGDVSITLNLPPLAAAELTYDPQAFGRRLGHSFVDERVTKMLARVEQYPDDVGAYVELGHALWLNGASREALNVYAEADRRGSEDASVSNGQGRIAAAAGKPWSAYRFFSKGMERAPGVEEFIFYVALSAAQLGWYDLALRHFDQLPVELSGWWASSRVQLRQSVEAARERVGTILRGRRRSPLRRDTTLSLASDLTCLGRLRTAESLLRPLFEATPAEGDVRLLRARLALRRDGLNAAVAIATDPVAPLQTHGELTRFGAVLLADAGRHDAAFEVLDRLPRSHWNWETWEAACNILLFSADPAQLLICAQEWAAVASADDAQPWRYVLAALRLSDDLPLWQELPPDCAAAVTAATTALAQTLPILQFWNGPELPEDVHLTISSWTRHNPDMRHILLDEPGAHSFLLDRFGQAAAGRFRSCHHPAMKADVLRLYYLLAHGGIYSDVDEQAHASIRPVLEALTECELVVSMNVQAAPYVQNWFFAARPGSRVIARAVAAMESALDAAFQDAALTGVKPNIWHVTGPGLITRVIATVLSEDGGIGGRSTAVQLMTEHCYRRFAQTNEELAYKRTAAGNWRLS